MLGTVCNPNEGDAACLVAQGLPSFVAMRGDGSPEGAIDGWAPGLTYYFDTTNEILYIFNGTARENTGWVAIN